MAEMMNRLLTALNAHDKDAFVACFAPDYAASSQRIPAEHSRAATRCGRTGPAFFAGVPDFHAELLASSTTDDGVEIGEWRRRGTHSDGLPFAMQGVTVMGIEVEHIAWARLYMGVIEQDGADIDQMVREAYHPPSPE